MNRRNFLKSTALATAGLAFSSFAKTAKTQKPNIILLFSDDAGYTDFGFQGNTEFKTPHLDQLAKEGVKCTSAYVTAAVCGPSRSGMITGRYQQRFGFEENNVPGYMSQSGLTGDDMGLPLNEKTIADYLKPLGYRSIILGKWHLGNADRYHPLKRGFDEFYGFRGGARHYFAYEKGKGRAEDQLERQFENYQEHEGYLTDELAKDACRFMEENNRKLLRDNTLRIYGLAAD